MLTRWKPLSRNPVTVITVAAALVLTVVVGVGAMVVRSDDPVVVVGFTGDTTSTAPAEPAVIPLPAEEPVDPGPYPGQGPRPEPPPGTGMKAADGRPYGPAIEFSSSISVPEHLVFVLVIGSDARPNEELLTARADSIHLLALNPLSGQGTVLGFPRDSYVEFPSGGRGKINDALTRGGPQLVAETVRRLTGLPVHYYVLTGFVGFSRMVDELGGVDVKVDRRMRDVFSGTRFEPGWHHFNGAEALAYTRDRNSVANGDFSRSEHQGTLLLAALAKLRSEVGDDAGLFRWLGFLKQSSRFDVPADHLPRLAALARRLAPERITNAVLPGRIGYAGKASVVYLSPEAGRMFSDLRDDAVLGNAPAPATTTTERPPPPTTTTSPEPPPETVPASTTSVPVF